MKIIITTHARDRFSERWQSTGTIEHVAYKSFKEGKSLGRSLQKTITLLGFHLPGYWTATYKVYKKFVFVFQKDNNVYILQTMFPLHFLKQRRRAMIARAYRRRKYGE